MIPSQLGLPHGEGFAGQHRSHFGGCPSERAAMPHSLPGTFVGAGFVPAAWSGYAWGIGKGLVFLKNFKNTSKTPRNDGEFVPSAAALLPGQPRALEPSGASPLRAVGASDCCLHHLPPASVVKIVRKTPSKQGSRGTGAVRSPCVCAGRAL